MEKLLRRELRRARENKASVEIELMSSTSAEVCELWDGKMIVRIFGSPDICELIMLPPKSPIWGSGGKKEENLEEEEEEEGRKPWELIKLQLTEGEEECKELEPVRRGM